MSSNSSGRASPRSAEAETHRLLPEVLGRCASAGGLKVSTENSTSPRVLVDVSGSVIGLALPGDGASAAAKGAAESLTLILAREMRGRGVSVNTVAPGPTATPPFRTAGAPTGR
ncbi:SDR family oxidoreductase [Spirillospora sp. NBC_01491]|uniref:SDR family oxidoreductase n=1 Tax=Spirillospora sp. NBC_01491 TaxID=2976007 RepID=UPI002E2F1A43|nr:SDR family oxidoreductase [Spirillospora sp. NBC_01491]